MNNKEKSFNTQLSSMVAMSDVDPERLIIIASTVMMIHITNHEIQSDLAANLLENLVDMLRE